MSVDYSITNTGYRLGRLFAVMERTRILADMRHGTPFNKHDIDAALTTTGKTFTTLFRVNRHHLERMKETSPQMVRQIGMEIMEICEAVAIFPDTLDTEECGMFVMGYRDQIQAMSETHGDAARADRCDGAVRGYGYLALAA